MDDKDRFEQGMRVRREVLGSSHVDHAVANLNDFNRDFQDFLARYAWGEIWSRPGLPLQTRSLLTLAIMVALNREEEFKMHIRAAFTNGVTRAEIQEVLLHSAIYCGLPAANNAFQWAQQVFVSMEEIAESKISPEEA
jgi:4-carboxymuconolactone decarboxylase